MTTKNKLLLGVLAVALIAFVSYKYNSTDSSASPIKIGVIAVTSGQYAAVGDNYVKGVYLAQEEWLKKNPNDKIEIHVEDDAFDPIKGLAAYQKLTGLNKIDVLLTMSSPTIDAIYSNIKQTGLPVAQGFEQGVDATDDNVFQLFPGSVATEIALGQRAKSDGRKKVVAFYANSAAYVRLLSGFEKGYGTIEKFPLSLNDLEYRTHVTKALALKPDAILFVVAPEQGAQLIKTIREQAREPYPFYFDANMQTGYTNYKQLLGDMNSLNGSTVVVAKQHMNAEFVSAFKAKYGSEPGIATDLGYDSFNFALRTHADSSPAWTQNMKKISFEGAGGKIVFDEFGVRAPDFIVGTITNGQLPQ